MGSSHPYIMTINNPIDSTCAEVQLSTGFKIIIMKNEKKTVSSRNDIATPA